MDQVIAVLVIPSEGDPGGLLAPGSAPAQGVRMEEDDSGDGYHLSDGGVYWRAAMPVVRLGVKMEASLPLWWDGALVPEGLDRALRCGGTDDCDTFDRHPSMDQVLELACWMVARGLASRVVRLARVDGRLVEVAS